MLRLLRAGPACEEARMLSEWEILTRLLVAAALGSLIGLDRERLIWAAGIRTHMVVCVGACLFMIVSAFGFGDVLGTPHVELDPSRVAAQVVSGIGFLGAGSIIARGEIVRGLTTAASIWTVAAIGLAVGGGLYFAAAASTVLIIVILAGLKPLEEAYRARNQRCHLSIQADRGALTPEGVRTMLRVRAGQVRRFVVRATDEEGVDEVLIILDRVSKQDIARFTKLLQEFEGVQRVQVVNRGRKRGGEDD
jgi:putative Mg2+ transporter-C (MgtC) family protein